MHHLFCLIKCFIKRNHNEKQWNNKKWVECMRNEEKSIEILLYTILILLQALYYIIGKVPYISIFWWFFS